LNTVGKCETRGKDDDSKASKTVHGQDSLLQQSAWAFDYTKCDLGQYLASQLRTLSAIDATNTVAVGVQWVAGLARMTSDFILW
jgi:hypothetical protein